MIAGNATAERTFRWVDSEGQVHYGNRVPPEYAKAERRVINEQGRTIQIYEAAKTPEERAAARAAAEAGFRDEMERLGVVIITSVPDDNSLWICDFCNTQIPADDEYTLIPVLGSYALCPPCVTTIPYWPDGWTQPTPRACRCGACQTPLLEASLSERRRTDRSLDGMSPEAGIGR